MSMYQVKTFEEGKFYVMTPPGEAWGDYEGPFDTSDQALTFLGQFINEKMTHSPEMLRMAVIQCRDNQTHLARSDEGVILNGEYLERRV